MPDENARYIDKIESLVWPRDNQEDDETKKTRDQFRNDLEGFMDGLMGSLALRVEAQEP